MTRQSRGLENWPERERQDEQGRPPLLLIAKAALLKPQRFPEKPHYAPVVSVRRPDARVH